MADKPAGNTTLLSGVFGTVECGEKTCLLVNTNVGLGTEEDGTALDYGDFCVIRADDSLRGGLYTDTVIHEFVHNYCPRWSEDAVKQFATQLKDLIYHPVIRARGALDVD